MIPNPRCWLIFFSFCLQKFLAGPEVRINVFLHDSEAGSRKAYNHISNAMSHLGIRDRDRPPIIFLVPGFQHTAASTGDVLL
jgi:hypothetical protein